MIHTITLNAKTNDLAVVVKKQYSNQTVVDMCTKLYPDLVSGSTEEQMIINMVDRLYLNVIKDLKACTTTEWFKTNHLDTLLAKILYKMFKTRWTWNKMIDTFADICEGQKAEISMFITTGYYTMTIKLYPPNTRIVIDTQVDGDMSLLLENPGLIEDMMKSLYDEYEFHTYPVEGGKSNE